MAISESSLNATRIEIEILKRRAGDKDITIERLEVIKADLENLSGRLVGFRSQLQREGGEKPESLAKVEVELDEFKKEISATIRKKELASNEAAREADPIRRNLAAQNKEAVQLAADRVAFKEYTEKCKKTGDNPLEFLKDKPKLFAEILKEEHEVIFQKGGRYSTFEAIWESILKAIQIFTGVEYDFSNSLDRSGKGPLDYLYASKPALELAVEHGSIDVNLRNKDGETAIMQAAKGGHAESFEYLMSKGADLTLTDKDGKNLLHKLAESRDGLQDDDSVKIKKLLVEAGQYEKLADQPDKDGKTPRKLIMEGLMRNGSGEHDIKGAFTEKVMSERGAQAQARPGLR